jgi:hypothetical protein
MRIDALFAFDSKAIEGKEIRMRLSRQNEMYALVRLRPEIEWIDYVVSPGLLLLIIMAFICSTLVMLAFLFAYLEIILRYVMGVPISMLLAWLQGSSQISFPPFIAIPPDVMNSLQEWFGPACMICSLILVVNCLVAKGSFRNVKSILFITLKRPSQTSLPLASQFVQISAPTGLVPTIIDAPSLTNVLDLVRDPTNTLWPVSETLAEVALAEAKLLEQHDVGIRISLSHELEITLFRPDGKQEICSFEGRNDTWVELIAYLAMQPKVTWTPKDTLLKAIYGDIHAEQYSLCKVHIKRIEKFLNEHAQEVGLLPEPKPKTEGSSRIILFEHDPDDDNSPRRLLSTCEVEIFPRTVALYQRVSTAFEDKQCVINSEDLYKRCEEWFDEYGKGLLANHQPRHRTWSWIRQPFIDYRDMCLYALNYAITHELNVLDQEHLTPDDRFMALNRVATMYGWYALVAIGLVPKEEQAEKALQQGLTIFLELKNLTAAEDIYQNYAESIMKKGEVWEPQPETTQIWESIMAQAQAAARQNQKHRQRTKRGRSQ